MATNPSAEADRVIELFRAEAAKRQHPMVEPLATTPAQLNLPGVRDLPLIQELATGGESHPPAFSRLPEVAAATGPGETPPPLDLPAPPVVAWWRSVKPAKESLDRLLGEAADKTQGPRWLPKFLRGLFRRQGRVNRSLLEATTLVGKTNEELRKQVRELTDAFQAQGQWLEQLAAFSRESNSRADAQVATAAAELGGLRNVVNRLVETRRADEQWMDAVSDAVARVRPLGERIRNIHADLQILRAALRPIVLLVQERLNVAAEELHKIQTRATAMAGEMRETRWNLMNVAEDVATLQAALAVVRGDLQTARSEATQLDERLTVVVSQLGTVRGAGASNSQAISSAEARLSQSSIAIERLESLATHLASRLAALGDTTTGDLARLEERLQNDIVYLKAQLSRQATRLDETTSPGPASKAGAKSRARAGGKHQTADDHQLDAFYLAFENEFRGSRELIQQRLQAYFPFLDRADVSGKRGGILDLGCGRGEWLELLQARGYAQVRGVDLNTAMIEQCRGRGLEVVHADALEYLRSLAEASVELVTSFHLIEHLPFRGLIEFLRQIERVLLPGGLIILETPNPRNILVGASDFFRDMTHHHPVHPDTIRFTIETVGMTDVACYFLQDAAHGRKAIRDTDYVFDDLRSYVDVPRDYAVIARKT